MSRAFRSTGDEGARAFGPQAASELVRGAAALDADALELLRRAEDLHLPWKRILSEEVVAESVLRRFLGHELRSAPMWRLLSILQASPLHSWRVRERVDHLAWESSQGSRPAKEELAQFHAMLSGIAPTSRRGRSTLATHQWLAYQRVLELRAIGELVPLVKVGADAVEFLMRSLGCSESDARWAVEGANEDHGFYALERAMRRAREEGFEIPPAENERDAFLRLRASLRRNGFLGKRAASRKRRA